MARDRLIGLVLCVSGIVLVMSALQIRRVIPIGIAPGTFPVLLAAILGVLGLVLMLRRPPVAATPISWPAPHTLIALVLFLALAGFTLLAFKPLGFVVTGAIVLTIVGRRLGAGWPGLLPIALLAPVTIHVVFERAFSVPLPDGILTGLLP